MDKNVRLKQDHLETIVMLGQAADLTEKIEKAEIARDAAKAAFEQQDTIYQEYCDMILREKKLKIWKRGGKMYVLLLIPSMPA